MTTVATLYCLSSWVFALYKIDITFQDNKDVFGVPPTLHLRTTDIADRIEPLA